METGIPIKTGLKLESQMLNLATLQVGDSVLAEDLGQESFF